MAGHPSSPSWLLDRSGCSLRPQVATVLTNWENHPMRQQHIRSLTFKTAGFQFVSSFIYPLYVGFWKVPTAAIPIEIPSAAVS